MVITREAVRCMRRNEQEWHNDRYGIRWTGAVFIPGEPIGEGSVRRFAEAIEREGISEASTRLAGQFFVAVQDKRRGTCCAFIDRGGIFDAFRSGSAISTSFLDLASREGLSAGDLNEDAVVEFVNVGYICRAGRTFFPAISKIRSSEVLTFSEDGSTQVLCARDVAIDRASEDFNVLRFFAKLVSSLRGTHVSVDLTGGTDSRLMAAMLDHFGLEFETAVSGWDRHSREIEVAAGAADALAHPFYPTIHRADDLEAQLERLLVIGDGLLEIFGFHRVLQLYDERVSRGVQLVVNSNGGELCKDFWWVQDFPFYSRRKSNIARLVGMRMLPVTVNKGIFSGRYAEANSHLRENLIRDFSQYTLATNSQTYDHIYFACRMEARAGRDITSVCSLIPSYAPLLELDMVRHGFHLPRGDRFFEKWHRRHLTRINPRLAKMRTTSGGGTTMSSDRRDMLLDVGRYVTNMSKRLARKLAERWLRRVMQPSGQDHPDLWPKVRSLAVTAEAIDRLISQGVLSPDVSRERLTNAQLGRLVVVAMLMKHLDEARRS
jgi:hypothetical protein